MMNRNHETPVNRLDERIAGCGRRIGEANENAREHEREAKAYDEAGGILASWNQQASGIRQDLHQHVKGDAAWRRLEQDDEKRLDVLRRTQNGCAEAYDTLTGQARREHDRDERENLRRVRREYENDKKRRMDSWD